MQMCAVTALPYVSMDCLVLDYIGLRSDVLQHATPRVTGAWDYRSTMDERHLHPTTFKDSKPLHRLSRIIYMEQ